MFTLKNRVWCFLNEGNSSQRPDASKRPETRQNSRAKAIGNRLTMRTMMGTGFKERVALTDIAKKSLLSMRVMI